MEHHVPSSSYLSVSQPHLIYLDIFDRLAEEFIVPPERGCSLQNQPHTDPTQSIPIDTRERGSNQAAILRPILPPLFFFTLTKQASYLAK